MGIFSLGGKNNIHIKKKECIHKVKVRNINIYITNVFHSK